MFRCLGVWVFWGSGLQGLGFWGLGETRKTNRHKEKQKETEKEKKKKKQEKEKQKKKKKKKKKKTREPQSVQTSANFDFGQFRWPKSNWPKSSILPSECFGSDQKGPDERCAKLMQVCEGQVWVTQPRRFRCSHDRSTLVMLWNEPSPFEHVLKTRVGCECVSHMFQGFLNLDPRATILSVDGVGAFNLISRNARLGCLTRMKGDKLLPFMRLFYSSPSFSWEDDVGTHLIIAQGEGGEQGDPLLLASTLHSWRSDRLDEGEQLVAFLDDLYALSGPDGTVDCHNILAEELWELPESV